MPALLPSNLPSHFAILCHARRSPHIGQPKHTGGQRLGGDQQAQACAVGALLKRKGGKHLHWVGTVRRCTSGIEMKGRVVVGPDQNFDFFDGEPDVDEAMAGDVQAPVDGPENAVHAFDHVYLTGGGGGFFF